MELIHEMVKRGKAAIIASHDPRVEEFADRILRMEDGRLKDDGYGGVRSKTENETQKG